jgi:hypothetical protein
VTDPAVPPPVAPTPAYAAAPAVIPGRTLGIVGLIVTFFFSLLGLILCIVAKVQSNNAGVKNTPATVGIVLGIVFLVGGIIAIVASTLLAASSGVSTSSY